MKKIKFLADVNIEKPIIDYLLTNGYDVKWVPDYNCQMTDEELLYLANTEKRILITNDKDFGELTFLQKRLSYGIILLRIKGQRVDEKVSLLEVLLKKHEDKLYKHFIIITRFKIKFRPMETIK